MTMAPRRHPKKALPISARERAIPFGPIAETEMAAVSDPPNVQLNLRFGTARSEHRAAVARLARSRRPGRAAKSP
jgi:hypothetical protein